MISLTLSEGIKLIRNSIFHVVCLTICLFCVSSANAGSLTVQCKVTKDVFGNQRSVIAVRSVGLKGEYYVTVFSGEFKEKSIIKKTNQEGKVDFRFDSDLSYLSTHPTTDQIGSEFIVNRRVVAVLRNADTNAHMGGIDTNCKNAKPKGLSPAKS